jgi:hypothetical protein
MAVICAILPGQEVEIIMVEVGVALHRCLHTVTPSSVEARNSGHDSTAFGYWLNNESF